MGQKASPLSLRKINNTILWTTDSNLLDYILIRNYLATFFYKKGLILNEITIKNEQGTLYINISFIMSRSSKLYTKHFRKNIKRAKTIHRYRRIFRYRLKRYFKFFKRTKTIKPIKLKRVKKSISTFLKMLTKLTKTKRAILKAQKLDNRLNIKLIKAIAKAANKIGLKRYMRYSNIKTLLIASSILVENPFILKANLIATLVSKQFAWIPKRSQKRFFTFLRNFWKIIYSMDKKLFAQIEGIKVQLNGRINGKTKASELKSIVGSISSQTIKRNIDYTQATSFSKFGTYGWSFWITKKNKYA